MRVLYIVTAFPRGPGDVITPWLIETIERLRERGIEVEVLAPSYRGSGARLYNGITVHRFRYAPARLETLTHDQTAPDRIRERPWYTALLPGYLLGGSVAAARLARSGRFDVVHAFWPLPHGLFALSARAAAGVPVVSTFFGVELTWLRKQLPFLAPLVRRIIRRSDAVTVISGHTASEVDRLVPGTEVRVVPFGAAGAASRSQPGRAGGEGDSGAATVLFVGRLVERKGVRVLLEAAALVRREMDARFTIVGDGPLAGPLRRRAVELGVDGIVEFTGLIDDAELERRFAGADLFVLPAVTDSKGDVEGLGVVLIEALLHGVPVIASDSGGIGDIVRDGETGLLVVSDDPPALAAAILRLLEDRPAAARLAEAGRAHVTENFSWERIIHQLSAVYAEVSAEDAAIPPSLRP